MIYTLEFPTPDELLRELQEKLKIITPDSKYAATYPHFIQYFRNIEEISEHEFFISVHFVYGWMRRIPKLYLDHLDDCIICLNQARSPALLIEPQFIILKDTINHSVIGPSKLLHFINPELYPIWDTNVCRFLYGVEGNDKVNNVGRYLHYLKFMHQVIQSPQMTTFYSAYKQKFHDEECVKLRAVENTMFYLGKLKKKRER